MREVLYEEEGAWIESHSLPNGESVVYKDGPKLHEQQRHSYWETWSNGLSCSGKIPGASTISKNDGAPSADGLMGWAVKEALAGREWKKTREYKGRVGSDSHTVLEDLSVGVPPLLESGYDHAVTDWWKKTKPQPEHVEDVVYSRMHNFAGRFDLIARQTDGQRVLLDLKTSNSIRNSPFIQLNLYRIAAIESGYPAPDRLVVLHVREDGGWNELAVPIRPDWAMAALSMYEYGKEITSEVNAAKKEPVAA